MWSKVTVAALASLAFLLPPVATAQRTVDGAGVGGVGCGEYLASRAASNKVANAQFEEWTRGYLSAYNAFSAHPQARPIPAPQTILAYLDKFCRDNPLQAVVAGVDSLIADLGGWRAPYLAGQKK